LGPIGIVGFGSLGLLVVLWLVISFTQPSPRRESLEWLGALCLYVSLCMLFLNLVLRAHASGSTIALIAFGFLGGIFLLGSCVTFYNLCRSLASGGGSRSQASATN
jgi:hypothetical protein